MTSAAESAKSPGGDAWRFYGLAALLGAALAFWVASALPGHVFNATRFILYDPGSYLYAIGRAEAGEAVYRDFAWQYGPLALGWYRAFAAIGGNTPAMLVAAASTAFVAGWVLIARLCVRASGAGFGGGFALFVLGPAMVSAGPFVINGPHGALELMLLAVIATCLGADVCGRFRAGWLGLAAGLLQWVRFGPHATALAVVLAVAAWQLRAGRTRRAWAQAVLRFGMELAGGYACALLPLAVWYGVALPTAGAVEQLWPVHMVAHYAATYPDRWPVFDSLQAWGTTWLPLLLGLGFAGATLARGNGSASSAPADRETAAAGLLFFPLYYLLGCALLFRNAYAFNGHLWATWPALALAPAVFRTRWSRALVALAILPALLALWHGAYTLWKTEQAWHAQPYALPNGQSLWFHGEESRNFSVLGRELAGTPEVPTIAVFIAGGGIHHFYRAPAVGRQWWFLPEFVRPWERDATQRALLLHQRLFVADLGQAPAAAPGIVALWLPLPESMNAAFLPHLANPRPVGTLGVMLDIRP